MLSIYARILKLTPCYHYNNIFFGECDAARLKNYSNAFGALETQSSKCSPHAKSSLPRALLYPRYYICNWENADRYHYRISKLPCQKRKPTNTNHSPGRIDNILPLLLPSSLGASKPCSNIKWDRRAVSTFSPRDRWRWNIRDVPGKTEAEKNNCRKCVIMTL